MDFFPVNGKSSKFIVNKPFWVVIHQKNFCLKKIIWWRHIMLPKNPLFSFYMMQYEFEFQFLICCREYPKTQESIEKFLVAKKFFKKIFIFSLLRNTSLIKKIFSNVGCNKYSIYGRARPEYGHQWSTLV